jgi:hypothetical protein
LSGIKSDLSMSLFFCKTKTVLSFIALKCTH